MAGRLPPGFALTSSGHLTGPPTALSGQFTFTVKVTEASAPPQSGIGTFALDFLPDGLPAAPSDVVATASNGSAAISWTPANSRGGPSVIGYTVSESYSGPHGCETNSASATSCVVSGLTNGSLTSLRSRRRTQPEQAQTRLHLTSFGRQSDGWAARPPRGERENDAAAPSHVNVDDARASVLRQEL